MCGKEACRETRKDRNASRLPLRELYFNTDLSKSGIITHLQKALSLKLLVRVHVGVSLIYAVSAFRALHGEIKKREKRKERERERHGKRMREEWPLFTLRWLSRNEVEIHYKQTLILRGLITTLPCPLSRRSTVSRRRRDAARLAPLCFN